MDLVGLVGLNRILESLSVSFKIVGGVLFWVSVIGCLVLVTLVWRILVILVYIWRAFVLVDMYTLYRNRVIVFITLILRRQWLSLNELSNSLSSQR